MADTPVSRIIDARELAPPEPMELTLEALDTLPRGEELQLWLLREPFPLYNILKNNGFAHRVEYCDDGRFIVHIRHAGA
ncbi:hypothetical protein dqs_3221 [Azoarcus olearius]|uniref:DUF2249 domain-containing protein n=1 Tax=Azoarcus sp. (strain BH72) TaxID=418699 RepID=UPI0008060D9B|nr:DUF2249 domain-containing protein [Azoarcus olearius]ANQ86249.1 hypothetical protein dqs_3221 [Azoarcus olearius]